VAATPLLKWQRSERNVPVPMNHSIARRKPARILTTHEKPLRVLDCGGRDTAFEHGHGWNHPVIQRKAASRSSCRRTPRRCAKFGRTKKRLPSWTAMAATPLLNTDLAKVS
jgi:hypothetical protein